jgi:hypothetical protein
MLSKNKQIQTEIPTETIMLVNYDELYWQEYFLVMSLDINRQKFVIDVHQEN